MKQHGKIHPKGIVEQAKGPTFTENDPAKFHGPGKTHGKTPANGVESGPHGTTFLVNSTHIPTPNADKPAKESKVIKTSDSAEFVPDHECCKDASTEGTSGGKEEYELKSSYEKSHRSGGGGGGVKTVDPGKSGGFHNRAMK